jgi:hypothetical protein
MSFDPAVTSLTTALPLVPSLGDPVVLSASHVPCRVVHVPSGADGRPAIAVGRPGSIVAIVAPAGDPLFQQAAGGAQRVRYDEVNAALAALGARAEAVRAQRRPRGMAVATVRLEYSGATVADAIAIAAEIGFNIVSFDYRGAALDPAAFALRQDAQSSVVLEALLLVHPPRLNAIERAAMLEMPDAGTEALFVPRLAGSFIKDVEKGVNKAAHDVDKAAKDVGADVAEAIDVGDDVVNAENAVAAGAEDAAQDVANFAEDNAEGANAVFAELEGIDVNQIVDDAEDGNQQAVMHDVADGTQGQAQDRAMAGAEAEAGEEVALAAAAEETEVMAAGVRASTHLLTATPRVAAARLTAEPNVDELLAYRTFVFSSRP